MINKKELLLNNKQPIFDPNCIAACKFKITSSKGAGIISGVVDGYNRPANTGYGWFSQYEAFGSLIELTTYKNCLNIGSSFGTNIYPFYVNPGDTYIFVFKIYLIENSYNANSNYSIQMYISDIDTVIEYNTIFPTFSTGITVEEEICSINTVANGYKYNTTNNYFSIINNLDNTATLINQYLEDLYYSKSVSGDIFVTIYDNN